MDDAMDDFTYCYWPESIGTLGVWGPASAFDFMLPVFLGQLLAVVLLTRIVSFILKPLRQPQVIAEIVVSVP